MFGIKPGLEATAELLHRVGNPERELGFIHIAGTNGKGSTGAMLECMLRGAGFTTGFYSSPHLIDIRERFRVNGMAVSDEDYLALSAELAFAARAESDTGKSHTFTYFEFTTVLAAMIFARAGVDIVIWETGMGGRLDATNVVRPIASVITGIALDHQAHLGNTLSEIAQEKAGIIKPEIPVFIGEMPQEVHSLIVEQAHKLNCQYYDLSPEIAGEVAHRTLNGRTVQEFEYNDRKITLPLIGGMQRRNFRLAAKVIEQLAPKLGIDIDLAFDALPHCRWPGRCQQVNERLIVDGGHNPDGAEALSEALLETFPNEKITVIFAGFKDKDIRGNLQIFSKIAAEFVFVPLRESDRPSYNGLELVELAKSSGVTLKCSATPDLASALKEAYAGSERKVLVAGSLYLAGDALKATVDPFGVLNLV
ncbi:MAG: bifunctional folylpolyglutamate synthase/dihydrofolate synthase [Victivallales bacterium]|nr:bifunctional folylpolyglutamate synthase/dihydrofolate synthase [Victivallales bacterium]